MNYLTALWLGPRLQSDLWTAGTDGCHSGGGMTGAAAGQGRTKRAMRRRGERENWTARAGTDVCWLELGTGSTMATKGTGTRSPSPNPAEKVAGLTNSSSATEAGEEGHDKQKMLERQPLFAGARG